MEAIIEAANATSVLPSTCAVCTHERTAEIGRDLARGVPQRHIVRKYGHLGGEDRQSRLNIERHIERCLRTTWRQMKSEIRIVSTSHVDNEMDHLLEEAKEAYYAAKTVLMVDGELNMNPREHEISVVYRDWNDRAEGKNGEPGEPKLKTALLSKLLAKISDSGFEPQHSYIKAEDARKGLRDCLSQTESIIDRFAKLRGAYQQDRKNEADEIGEIRKQIRASAEHYGHDYEIEVVEYLRLVGHRLRPDLRGMLVKESQSLVGALGGGVAGGESPLRISVGDAGAVSENIGGEKPGSMAIGGGSENKMGENTPKP